MYTLIVVILSLQGPAIAVIPGLPSQDACLAARAHWIEAIGKPELDGKQVFAVPAAVCIATEGQIKVEDIARRTEELLNRPGIVPIIDTSMFEFITEEPAK